jgi:hypothetical protein
MRALLRRLGPRYGFGLGLVVIVVIVIALAHTFGHHRDSGLVTGGSASPTAAVSTGPPDDGEGAVPTPAAPSVSPGAASPRTVAGKFADAWLNHDVPATQWHAALAKYATTELSGELNGADPAGVPADRISGEFTQIDIGADYVQFAVPTDTGTLTLSLQSDHGRWLVSGIDWTAA